MLEIRVSATKLLHLKVKFGNCDIVISENSVEDHGTHLN